jgi:hypothetical protein
VEELENINRYELNSCPTSPEKAESAAESAAALQAGSEDMSGTAGDETPVDICTSVEDDA